MIYLLGQKSSDNQRHKILFYLGAYLSTMKHEKHVFEYTLKDKNGDKREFTIEDVEEKSKAYSKLRDKYCSNNNITVREFEKQFEVEDTKHKVSFRDPPWDSGTELKNDLESIDGVVSASYMSPFMGAYGPPKYLLTTKKDYEDIKSDIKDYYEALTTEKASNGVYVIISPRS